MSEAKDVEYFGDGLAEEILNLLARLNEMNVASRTSSFYFKNKDADIEQIGAHLGVNHVLEGSIRKQGELIRVTAQLIDVKSGFHLWSETYDRNFDNIFSIQDDIARQVVENLQLILSSDSLQALERQATLDPVAYDYYLQGRDYLRRPSSPENLDQAIGLFDKSVALDPGYAGAYAGLCDSYLEHYSRSRDVIHFEKAENACQRALSLDDKATAVYVALGNLYRHSGLYGLAEQEFNTALGLNPNAVDAYSGLAETQLLDNRPEIAEKTFLKAIELQPNDWRGYRGMGNFLFETGRIGEAIPYYQRNTELMPDNELALNNLGAAFYLSGQFEQATEAWQKSLQLKPTVVVYSNLGSSLYFLARFEEATQMYQKAVELAPEDFESWGNLGDSYRFADGLEEYAAPMYRNAIKLAMELLKINPSDAETMSLVAHYQANIGEREQALQYMARATALAPQNWTVHYNAATALAALEELEQAMTALEKALALGYSVQMVEIDRSLAKLRELPQFQAMTRLTD
jgi:TolB-like protein/Flp pilus assembly protein TadD